MTAEIDFFPHPPKVYLGSDVRKKIRELARVDLGLAHFAFFEKLAPPAFEFMREVCQEIQRLAIDDLFVRAVRMRGSR